MTISTTTSTITLQGNGATTNFAFPFVADSASDLVVTYTDSSGNETVLPASAYTIVLNAIAPNQIWAVGGTCTYPLTGSPIATNTTLTITRILPLTQLVTISNQGDFNPEVIETALDELEMQIQQVSTATSGRAIVAPLVDVNPQMVLPAAAQRALQFLAFDSSGNVTVGLPGNAPISLAMQPVVAASTTTAAETLLGVGASVTPEQFGALGNGTHDDTAAINAAIATGNPVEFSAKTYLCTGNILIKTGTILRGAGSYGIVGGAWASPTTLLFHGNSIGVTTTDANLGEFTIEKMGFVGDYLTYTNQIGLYLNDSVRTAFETCEGTLRDCLFKWFSTGVYIGNKYQSLNLFNVACISCSAVGCQIYTSDCYTYNLTCGNSNEGSHTNVASTAQLFLGGPTGSPGGPGSNQIIGGAFYGGAQTVLIQNSFDNVIFGAAIQLATGVGLLIGDGTHGANLNFIVGCLFSDNNQAGGVRNANHTSNEDCLIQANSRGNHLIGCQFAANGSTSSCVAAAVGIGSSCEATTVTNCTFNMDLIVPSGGGAPTTPVFLPAALNILDVLHFNDNWQLFGFDSILSFGVTRYDLPAAQIQYTTSGAIAISPGAAILNTGSGALSMTLANPGYVNRQLTIAAIGSNTGSTVVAATSGGFENSHTTLTFTATGSVISLVSISATQWRIVSNTSVTPS